MTSGPPDQPPGMEPDERWTYFRAVGHAGVGRRRTSILSFYGPEGIAPYWFRLSV